MMENRSETMDYKEEFGEIFKELPEKIETFQSQLVLIAMMGMVAMKTKMKEEDPENYFKIKYMLERFAKAMARVSEDILKDLNDKGKGPAA